MQLLALWMFGWMDKFDIASFCAGIILFGAIIALAAGGVLWMFGRTDETGEGD